jgi:hypothetical protein
MERPIKVLDQIQVEEPLHTLVLVNKTPRINPGEQVNIDIYLSGYGVPERNKLHIQWSSPHVVARDIPGHIEGWLDHESLGDGVIKPKKRSVPMTSEVDPIGITLGLPISYFIDVPREPRPEDAISLRQTASEGAWVEPSLEDSEPKPPISLTLNTAKDAQAGDYRIMFTLTYTNKKRLRQDYKEVPLHITSKRERLQERWQWFVYVGVLAAILSLILTGIWYATHWTTPS